MTTIRSSAPMTRTIPAVLAAVAGLSLPAAAQSAQTATRPNPDRGAPRQAEPLPGDVSLTIYSRAQPGAVPPEVYRPIPGSMGNSGMNYWGGPQQVPGYAVVRHVRRVDLPSGIGEHEFTGVAALIDPTTVSFVSLTSPDRTSVLEQSYQFDLVGPQKLLEKYVGQEVTVTSVRGDQTVELTGTLLAAGSNPILRMADGSVQLLSGFEGISFPALPEGLITTPTLLWRVENGGPEEQEVRVAYETQGITWWADYNLVFAEGADGNSGTLDVSGWSSILNQSGATYRDAQLKLIAGDVHRAPQPPQPQRMYRGMEVAAAADAGFAERSFFEYHLYTLGRRVTIPDNSTMQIELFDAARGVPARKVLVYNGTPRFQPYGQPMIDRNFGLGSPDDVAVYVEFDNAEEHGLGIPLPAGRVRVSQLNEDDGTLEFIGEDVLGHTPRNEEVRIRLGNAFDVVGERTQRSFTVDAGRRTLTETIEIEVRNRKDEPVDVIIAEVLYRWTNWEITERSADFERIDASTIHFPVTVPADGAQTVTYTVRYTW